MKNLGRSFLFLSLSLMAFCAVLPAAWSCQMNTIAPPHFLFSRADHSALVLSDEAEAFARVDINDCKKEVGQYIGLAIGLQTPGLAADTNDVSIDGDYHSNICELQSLTAAQNEALARNNSGRAQDFQTLRSCAYTEVETSDTKPIYIEPSANCQITKLTPSKIELRGKICFIRILPELQLHAYLRIEKNCAQRGLSQDLDFVLQGFVSPNQNGSNTTVLFGAQTAHLSIVAGSLESAESPEDLLYANYSSQLRPGPIEITPEESNVYLNTSVLAENIYAYGSQSRNPLTPQIELWNLDGGHPVLIDQWVGGYASHPMIMPNWLGLAPLGRHRVESDAAEFPKEFRLVVRRGHPYDDLFVYLRSSITTLIDRAPFNGLAGRDVLQPLMGFSSLMGMNRLPILDQLGTSGIDSYLTKLGLMLRDDSLRLKVPYYKYFCTETGCASADNRDSLEVLALDYTVEKKFDDKGLPVGPWVPRLVRARKRQWTAKGFAESTLPLTVPQIHCQGDAN